MKTLMPIRRHNGFTLVELMLVMVIIAILLTISVISYDTVTKKSRDDRRSADMTILRNGIEKYYADNGEYPPACPTGDGTSCSISNMDFYLKYKGYVNKIPSDPTASSQAEDYQYIRLSASDRSYGIFVNYETKPDCKTGKNMVSTWWSSAPKCSD